MKISMATKIAELSIAHLNIRGLFNKVDEMKLLFVKCKLKMLHLCETFLTPSIDSSILHIPNYSIIYRYRVVKHGGGVVSYIHSSIKYCVISKFDSILPETVTLKICQNISKPYITTFITSQFTFFMD